MKNGHSGINEWVRVFRDSGVWFAFVVFAVLSVIVGSIDVVYWDSSFGQSILAESNVVLLEILLIGVILAVYDYRRRRIDAVRDADRELGRLLMWNTPEGVLRKVELIDDLAHMGRKPANLQNQNLTMGRLNGFDLSGINMRFAILSGSRLICTTLVATDLQSADFSNSCLVEADLTRANLYEADFSAANLGGAILAGADVTHADFREARELTCEQLMSADNWETAHRDPELACGAPMPSAEKSLGHQFRALHRQRGNPDYPYRLVAIIDGSGIEKTRAERVEEE